MRIHLQLNIRTLRKSRKITQQQLAEIIGKSHTIIVNYEKGKVTPPLDVLIELADIFEVSLDELVRHDLSKTKSEEPPQKYQVDKDWKFIALQLGRDLRRLQQHVHDYCPKLWVKLNISNQNLE